MSGYRSSTADPPFDEVEDDGSRVWIVEWKVSVAALVDRLHAIRMLTEWQYRSLFVKI